MKKIICILMIAMLTLSLGVTVFAIEAAEQCHMCGEGSFRYVTYREYIGECDCTHGYLGPDQEYSVTKAYTCNKCGFVDHTLESTSVTCTKNTDNTINRAK